MAHENALFFGHMHRFLNTKQAICCTSVSVYLCWPVGADFNLFFSFVQVFPRLIYYTCNVVALPPNCISGPGLGNGPFFPRPAISGVRAFIFCRQIK